MIVRNLPVEEFVNYIQGKMVYIYGVGDFYVRLTRKVIYRKIHNNIVGYIDNGKAGTDITVFGQEYAVHSLEYMKTVPSGIVLICGTKYLDEMYAQLEALNLPDTIECFMMPLIWIASDGVDDDTIMKRLDSNNDTQISTQEKIEKTIHCFWFSGEEKPDKYKCCIDTWKKVCPDYQIVEWNADNYDWKKNVFMKQAFESRKWAFVSDYARLDVIYNHGGIYLDMDVELIKDFEPLLQFDAFFNYGTRHLIELGSSFGAKKGNAFIRRLLERYKDVEFLDADGVPQLDKYVQPVWLNEEYCKEGIRMDGSMQLLNEMLILPRRFYTPKDDIFLYNSLQCEDTRGIHHFNSEWKPKEYLEERDVKSLCLRFV